MVFSTFGAFVVICTIIRKYFVYFGAKKAIILVVLKLIVVLIGFITVLIETECNTTCGETVKPNVCKMIAFTTCMRKIANKLDLYVKEIAPKI